MLELTLLGTPIVQLDGRPVTADTRKAIALLAYLAVEGPTSRDTLATLLWPESPDSQARATLRRTLSAVRSAMGDGALVSDRQTVRLGDDVGSDIARSAELLAKVTQHDHQGADACALCIPILEEFVGLHRGEFLAGFNVRGSAEFEDWTRSVSETQRLAAGRAHERLATAKAGAGDLSGAIESVNAWLQLDPLREPAFRQLMLLYAWSGDAAGATDAYRRCVAVLSRELGVDPLEETTELYEAILDDDLPPAPGVRRKLTTAPAPPVPVDLIDRKDQLTTLVELALDDGPGRVVLLIGDAWMGKSRLLDEVADVTAAASRPVITAKGYRSEQHLPYGGASQLLTSLTSSAVWDDVKATVPAWALDEAARLHPEMGTPVAAVTTDPFAETRLFDALLRVLTAPSGLLIVDDGQWIDPSSSAFLAYLANRIETTTSRLFVAQRPGDGGPGIQPDATHGSSTTIVRLGPLQPSDIDGLSDQPSEVIESTGGIPALVAERIASGDSPEQVAGVRRFIDARLEELDPLSRQILAAAAIVGGTSDIDLLRDTSGRDEDEVVETVESLVKLRILEPSPDGSLAFVLDAMAERIQDETTQMRRRILHRRAAESFRRQAGAATDVALAAQVAFHLAHGGEDGDAAEWYRIAGDLALQVFAAAEAIDSYRSAMALGHGEPGRLHLGIGNCLLFLGRYHDAAAEFEKAAATENGAGLALAEHKIGEANRRLGRIEMALDRFAVAETEHPDPVDLYCDWALALLRSGDRSAARSRADLAVDAAGEDAKRRSRALSVLGLVTANGEESRESLEKAYALAGDDPVLRMAALNGLGHWHARNGEAETAAAEVEEALGIALEIGDRHRAAALYNHLADLHHREGREDEAERCLTEAVQLFVEVEPGAWEPEVWLLSHW